MFIFFLNGITGTQEKLSFYSLYSCGDMPERPEATKVWLGPSYTYIGMQQMTQSGVPTERVGLLQLLMPAATLVSASWSQ